MFGKKGEEIVLDKVRKALKEGRIRFSEHALLRMDERDIRVFDVEQVIKYGKRELVLDKFDKKGNYWRYVIRNRDVDERDLAISVDIENPYEIVIVTVMQIDPVTVKKI